MKRREFLARSLGLPIAGLGLQLAVSAGPSVASPTAGHRVLDIELLDADRQRPVPARLYLPYLANPDEPVPLVVFSHGLGGSRMGYSYLARYWADAGMASLHPQHVGSDSNVWRGNPIDLVQRLQSAARDAEALARAQDLRFALDQVLASDHGRLIDVTQIVVAGHSYGANTAMLVAGAQVKYRPCKLGRTEGSAHKGRNFDFCAAFARPRAGSAGAWNSHHPHATHHQPGGHHQLTRLPQHGRGPHRDL